LPDKLLPPLKAIWLAALQPCGVRLKACLPEWLANDEADHRRLDADVRLRFGFERYEHPEVWPLINVPCQGPLDHQLNSGLPTIKLQKTEQVRSLTVRQYGPTCTPLARVLACAEVSATTKAQLRAERVRMNAFAVRREVDRQLKAIEAARRWTQP